MIPHLLALALGAFLGVASESLVVFLLCWWAFALAFSPLNQGKAGQATRWPATRLRSRSGAITSTLSPQA